MKKLLFFLFASFVSAAAFAQSCKVVVDSRGECVGTWVKTNANTYTVFGQDEIDVPKKGHKVVLCSAEAGQGYISCKNPGSVNIRSTPSTSGSKVGTLSFYEGDMPDFLRCLGKTNGWYKVRLENGKTGYIRADVADWSPMGY